LYIVVTCIYAQLDAVAAKDTGPRVVCLIISCTHSRTTSHFWTTCISTWQI